MSAVEKKLAPVRPLRHIRSYSYGVIIDVPQNDPSSKIYRGSFAIPSPSARRIDREEGSSPAVETSPLLGYRSDRRVSLYSVASSRSRRPSRIRRITPPLFISREFDLHMGSIRSIGLGKIDQEDAELEEALELDDSGPAYTKRDKLMVAMISAATFCSTVVFSCIAPFFPEEAKRKGASQTTIGLVFSIFQLIMFIASPILGRYLTQIRSKFMYGTGLTVTGVTAILFGLLNMAPSGTSFVVLAFVVRSFEAVGDAAIMTSAYAIVGKTFASRVATVIGIVETFNGMGFAFGPPIGGALYQIGGFPLPFMVLGILLIIAGLTSFCVIPPQNDTPSRSRKRIWRLLRTQTVLTMVFSIIVGAISISFLDPTLQPHIQQFDLSPFLVGLVFLIVGGSYSISALFWGYLIDQKDCAKWVLLFGCASCFAALFFIGPSPLLPLEKTLWIIAISEVLMGIGLSALLIPPYQQCLKTARRLGYPDRFETYGVISGLFQSSLAFGSFLGPTIGGIGVEWYGFAWTSTAVSLLPIICATLIVFLIVRDKHGGDYADIGDGSSSRSSPFAPHHQFKPVLLCSESCSLRSIPSAC